MITNEEELKKCQTWDDLHELLSSIVKSNPKKGGELFEVFAFNFFKKHPVYSQDYKNVWLNKGTPQAIKRKLALPTKDYGYDLILETHDGKLAVVQCKFVSDQNEVLGWSKNNLSSWIGVSSKADIVIIFTNASGIDKVSKSKSKEKTFREISLSHLKSCAPEELKSILSKEKVKLAKSKPRPHQIKAISAIKKYLPKEKKGQLIMPCGSGKTLTAFWAKKALNSKKTIVMVPSLNLLQQFKNQWMREEPKPIPYLCVCSDREIDSDDSPSFTLEELCAPVTTDISEISSFLKENENYTIFSTYQSSHVLSKAITGAKADVDLAICDEAHRTAGPKTGKYSIVTNDKAFPSKYKIFMTATPRVVSEAVKDKLGNQTEKLIADMGNHSQYGRRIFEMKFSDAIGTILSDYQIVAVGVTDSEVKKAIDNRRYTSLGTLDEVAHNIALKKIFKKYKATHAVTFHSSVKRAQNFLDRHKEIYSGDRIYHVNGSQPTNERALTLDEFRNDKEAIITNARCLTEGVDVPRIDCVYFCDPKSSIVDIVQATGRALRKTDNPNKIGYIVVPIFHKKGQSLEAAIEQGVYKDLIRVIRAMASQDSRIEDEIRAVSLGEGPRTLSVDRSRVTNKALSEHIVLTDFSEKIRDSIFTEVVQKTVMPWRDFESARDFVRKLSLKRQAEWVDYTKGKIRGKIKLPADIPAYPGEVYSDSGWKGMGDWLGTGRVANHLREYRSFAEARRFARGLSLRSANEWREYTKFNLPGKPRLPADIPANPNLTYGNKGWKGMGDWLGTGRVANHLREYRTFTNARQFVRTLGLRNVDEWRRFTRGQLKNKPKFPSDIPVAPNKTYKDKGWKGFGDWLGTGTVASFLREYRGFTEARSFARGLKLGSRTQWQAYTRGGIKGKPKLPDDIPAYPEQSYVKKGWSGYGDWLGTGTIAPQLRQYRSFIHARKFARRLKLESQTQWFRYTKSGLKGRPRLPIDIPTNPNNIYADNGWRGFGDWLGTGRVAPRLRQYRSFAKARSFVRGLNLKNREDWVKYTKGELRGKQKIPRDIPAFPERTYKGKGWKGVGDWLGTGRVANRLREYRSFEKARNFVHSLKLKSEAEWRLYTKGEPKEKPRLPDDIPANPMQVYRDKGWKGLGDWLGTGTIAPRLRKYRDFQKARKFARSLNLKSRAEWAKYTKGQLKGKPHLPEDIPVGPNRTYAGKGWKGMGDWLGTGIKAPVRRKK